MISLQDRAAIIFLSAAALTSNSSTYLAVNDGHALRRSKHKSRAQNVILSSRDPYYAGEEFRTRVFSHKHLRLTSGTISPFDVSRYHFYR